MATAETPDPIDGAELAALLDAPHVRVDGDAPPYLVTVATADSSELADALAQLDPQEPAP